MSVPLHLRLPNPPAHFTGRAAEQRELGTALERAPVAAVWGLGGVGKTTLALATLHQRFPQRVDATLFVALGEDADPMQELVRALTVAVGGRMDWREMLTDPEALLALAIDLAESVDPGWWLVVDDLHRADPKRAQLLLQGFARYARTARLLVTTRVEPQEDALAGQVVALGAMPVDDLETLARRVGLDERGAREHAVRAAGSPWRLLSQVNRVSGGEDLGLQPSVAEFLGVLSPLEAPVPAALLEGELPASSSLAELARQGLLESAPAGFRLHDVVRELLPPAADRAARAAELVASTDRPDLTLEAIRLFLVAERPEAAARLASDRLEPLLAEGLAPRLWALLAARREEDFASVRLRCAVALGSVEAAGAVRLPADASLQDHLNWAHAQRFIASLDDVAVLAAEVLERAAAAGDGRVAFEAGLLRGRCGIQSISREGAVAEVEALEPTNEDERVRRDHVLAQLLVNAGQMDRAVELARGCLRRAAELSESTFEEVTAGVGRVFYMAGLLDETEAAVRDIERRFGRASLASFHTRSALNILVHVLHDRADLAGMQEVLRGYAPLVGGSSILGVSVRMAIAMQRLLAGDLDGLESYLDESSEFARASGSVNSEVMLAATACRLDTLHGRRHVPARLQPPDPVLRALYSIWQTQNRLRQDDPPTDLELADLGKAAAPNPELALVAQLLHVERDLLAGVPAAAAASAARITSALEERGLILAWAEASLLHADALLAADEPSRALDVATAVQERAERMPSPRLAAEARLLQLLCEEEFAPGPLDELADGPSPVAARRARALTGESPTLDHLDRVVIEAAQQRISSSMEIVADTGATRWGIDAINAAVWLPGRVVSLAHKPMLFRLLEELARNGGRASKETLVKRVWDVDEYHPLRHDNRLHLAILKLRREIEPDPKNPNHLLASADGYQLAGCVRLRT